MLRDIELQLGGRVGVYALDTYSGTSLAHRAGERFAMASTFKWILAAQALAAAARGAARMDERLTFGEGDLLSYAPVARARLADGALSIEECCAAIVEVSDNTAANLLLARFGGPAALTAFVRGHGDRETRLDRTEPALNENAPGDPRDTTTPAAMAGLMRALLVEDGLDAASREKLIGWMVASTTGLQRLRAGLPPHWRVGDKTGTGANGAVNDVAIAFPPGRAPILIAAYTAESGADIAAHNAAFAEIGRVVGAAFS